MGRLDDIDNQFDDVSYSKASGARACVGSHGWRTAVCVKPSKQAGIASKKGGSACDITSTAGHPPLLVPMNSRNLSTNAKHKSMQWGWGAGVCVAHAHAPRAAPQPQGGSVLRMLRAYLNAGSGANGLPLADAGGVPRMLRATVRRGASPHAPPGWDGGVLACASGRGVRAWFRAWAHSLAARISQASAPRVRRRRVAALLHTPPRHHLIHVGPW